LTTLKYFREEYEAHIHAKQCPAGVCKPLITFQIAPEDCTGCGACKKVCPSDCITGAKGQPARWKVENGYMEVVDKAGGIRTTKGFGDCQLHVEWMAPAPAKGKDQDRGNSGVFLMDTYEVQVLDCYGNTTYPDGMTAALYGQHPPLVNACRPPGEWQTYDIVFHRPRFDKDGKVLAPARMTVFHNGLVVHECAALTGPTTHKARPPYKIHADRLPVSLQDHGHPVRFRNIWIRDLE
ncbi:MAG: DUF1080 domain-containing protein, partial [Candidatus Aminicenantes bacterium]|nr:DUF1080 domain-containing protein [Candidatus Aminicenantes bacterium]